ncbi:MAG: phage tail tape measure protein [Nocardioides sp.]
MTDRSVTYRLRAEVSQFRAQMAAAGSSVKAAGDKMTSASKESSKFRAGLTEVGSTAGKVGLLAAGGLTAMVVSAANFDQAMSKVQAATHDSASEMDQLRAAAIKAGALTKYSASEAAEGIEALAKAGVSTKDILAGGLSGALSLAAAGNQSVGDSAETAASAMTQFRLSGSDIPHIADLLAAGAGKAQGEVSDLAMALNQAGLVASQTGLSIDETTAGLSAFASAGLIGSDAGTSFKTMLLRLTPQSQQARNLMDQLNLSAYNQQGQFIGLAKYAGVLHDRLKDMSAEQRNATLQTLFGQDAIRAANVLYQQGAAGIESWTKKVDDQGYAAETAAIKMDNLRGDLEQLRGSIETAFIGAGEGSQGPLRTLVQHVTDVVNAYNRLPQAGKNATTGLLAVTAVVGGGLWFTTKIIKGVADTRLALDQLGVSATRTSGRLVRIGASAGTILVAAQAMGALVNASLDLGRAVNSSDIPRDLEAIAGGGQTDSLNKLAGALKGVNETGAGTVNTLFSIPSAITGIKTSFQTDTDTIEEFDQQLASLVEGGHAQEAASAFQAIKDAAADQGVSASDVTSRFDAYRTAIQNAASASDAATASTQGLAGAVKRAGKTIEDTSQAAQAARKTSHQYAESWVGMGKDISNAKVSLTDWIKELQHQADALKNFRVNAQTAAKKGLDEGLIVSLNKAGPTGALRMKQLADATKQQIAAANAAWRSQSHQVDLSTDQIASYIAHIPQSWTTRVAVNGVDQAIQQALAVKRALDGIDKVVNVHINVTRNTNALLADVNTPPKKHASGGSIVGPGGPTSDSVPIWASNGEFMMRASAVNRYGLAFMTAVNAGRFASGGLIGASGEAAVQSGSDDPQHRALRHSLAADSKALDDHKQHLDSLTSTMKQYASSVAGTFRSDLFGDTSAWGSSSPQATLKTDIANAKAMNQALHRLVREGVHGGALAAVAESGNLQAAQQLAAHPGRYQHLFRERQQETAKFGAYASQERYGDKIDAVRAEVAKLRREVTHLRHEAPHNADRAGKATGRELNSVGGRAVRQKRP